jgi:hypothetical protein
VDGLPSVGLVAVHPDRAGGDDVAKLWPKALDSGAQHITDGLAVDICVPATGRIARLREETHPRHSATPRVALALSKPGVVAPVIGLRAGVIGRLTYFVGPTGLAGAGGSGSALAVGTHLNSWVSCQLVI